MRLCAHDKFLGALTDSESLFRETCFERADDSVEERERVLPDGVRNDLGRTLDGGQRSLFRPSLAVAPNAVQVGRTARLVREQVRVAVEVERPHLVDLERVRQLALEQAPHLDRAE